MDVVKSPGRCLMETLYYYRSLIGTIAPFQMTLSDFQGQSPVPSHFNCDFSQSCAVISNISADVARRAVLLRQLSFLFRYLTIVWKRCTVTMEGVQELVSRTFSVEEYFSSYVVLPISNQFCKNFVAFYILFRGNLKAFEFGTWYVALKFSNTRLKPSFEPNKKNIL